MELVLNDRPLPNLDPEIHRTLGRFHFSGPRSNQRSFRFVILQTQRLDCRLRNETQVRSSIQQALKGAIVQSYGVDETSPALTTFSRVDLKFHGLKIAHFASSPILTFIVTLIDQHITVSHMLSERSQMRCMLGARQPRKVSKNRQRLRRSRQSDVQTRRVFEKAYRGRHFLNFISLHIDFTIALVELPSNQGKDDVFRLQTLKLVDGPDGNVGHRW